MDLTRLKQIIRPLEGSCYLPSSLESKYFSDYGLDLETDFFGVEHRFGYIDSSNYRIVCHFYSCADAAGSVFILHGYFDHSGYFRHIIRFFLEQNLNVLIYDLPGHGLSSGKSASIPDFNDYSRVLEDLQNYCHQWLPKPWYGFGQSTGSAILTDFLLEKVKQNKSLPFEKLILSAPLVRPRLWHLSRIQLHFMRFFIKQIPRKYTQNSRDPSFLKLSHNDPLSGSVLPTEWLLALDKWVKRIESCQDQIPFTPAIIQGTHDGTVDADHNIPVLQRLYQKPSVFWLENARHHLPNELPETRQQYFDYLKHYLWV